MFPSVSRLFTVRGVDADTGFCAVGARALRRSVGGVCVGASGGRVVSDVIRLWFRTPPFPLVPLTAVSSILGVNLTWACSAAEFVATDAEDD